MADPGHLKLALQGRDAIIQWRHDHPTGHLDLEQVDLSGADLHGVDLRGARLYKATLTTANLSGANLSWANLPEADLSRTDLRGAKLLRAYLRRANLYEADLSGANLHAALLFDANLVSANLSGTQISAADLRGANLSWANLSGAYLYQTDLWLAQLVETNLEKATLTDCRVFGVAAWNVRLDGAQQSNLLLTPPSEPAIRVDDLEVAQFIYLVLHNDKVRRVIDTITSKAVLILGRFTPERKAVLDSLRQALRGRGYVPILFDFDIPTGSDITQTVTLLARMARFIVADLTEPSSIPHELQAIVPDVAVPVLPLLEGEERPYSMFADHWKYDWVLQPHRYTNIEGLIDSLPSAIIEPAEAKAKELATRRAPQ